MKYETLINNILFVTYFKSVAYGVITEMKCMLLCHFLLDQFVNNFYWSFMLFKGVVLGRDSELLSDFLEYRSAYFLTFAFCSISLFILGLSSSGLSTAHLCKTVEELSK